MPIRTLVIVNPQSRGGATGRRWASIEGLLRDALGPLDVEHTRGPRDAERIAREGVRAGAELVVAAGGDGTATTSLACRPGDLRSPPARCALRLQAARRPTEKSAS